MQPEPIDVTPPPSPPPPSEPSSDGPAPAAGGSRRPRVKTIVLGSLLVVGLAGAAVVGTAGWRIWQQKDAQLDTPADVAGLRLDESERAATTAEYLRTALNARIDLDQSIGVVYADPAAADRSVLLFGGTTMLLSPERDLDSLFDLLSDDTGKVTGLAEVPAGELDGVMKCGTSSSPDGDISVCGWADHGSVAIALFPEREVDDAAALLREIREAVQTRD